MINILECPCASEENRPYTTVSLEFDRVNKLYRIICYCCLEYSTEWHFTQEEAIDEWNQIVNKEKYNGK